MTAWRYDGVVTSAEGDAYRAAIIGTGRIASSLERDPLRSKPHTHAGWYASHPRTRLVAGADVDPDRLAAFGVDWGITHDHLYADFQHMLARERPDLVSICAYAPDRVAMCRAALAAGARGLWIEKAVACSVAEARALDAELVAAGVSAIVDHPRREEARYRAVARWLREQRFGRLETVHVLFSGHIVHTGTHAWDLLLDWCGPWTRVDASLDPLPAEEEGSHGDGRDDDAALHSVLAAELARGAVLDRGGRAHVTFASGVEAFVTGGAKSYFAIQCDLVCEAGRMRVGNDVWEVLEPAESPRYSGFRELAPLDTASLITDADRSPGSLLAQLVAAVETRRAPAQSVGAAAEALALGVAIVQSGLTGTPVTRDTLDEHLRIASI